MGGLNNLRIKEKILPTLYFDMGTTETHLESDNSLVGTAVEGTIPYRTGSEKITYTNGSKQRSNMCIHERAMQFMGVSGQIWRFEQPPSGVYYLTRNVHRNAWFNHASASTAAYASLGVNLGGAVLGSQAQGLINAFALRVRPDLTTVSVPNFLLEIEDLRGLAELWKANVSLAKNVAGAHLNYKFGWKPTIGDISGIVVGLEMLQERMQEFRESLNRLFKRHQVLDTKSISQSGSFAQGDDQINWTITYKGVISAGLSWRPQPLAVINGLEATLRGFLDTLGVELNPRIIWDALPFTFVVDWFFGVGSWLDGFKIDTLELPIAYVDSYLQYKEEITIESSSVVAAHHPTISTPINAPGVVSTSKYFQRMPLFPDYATLSGLGWRFPTRNQALLLVSLATVLISGKKAKDLSHLTGGTSFTYL